MNKKEKAMFDAIGKALGVSPKNVGDLIKAVLEKSDVYDFCVGYDEDEDMWFAKFNPIYEGYGDTFEEAVLRAACDAVSC